MVAKAVEMVGWGGGVKRLEIMRRGKLGFGFGFPDHDIVEYSPLPQYATESRGRERETGSLYFF